MKMTKKILLGAVAFFALAFTSCDNSLSSLFQKEYGEPKVIDYTDATYESGMGTWTVNSWKNEDDHIKRAIKLLSTKHSDIAAVAKINSKDADGVELIGEQGVIGVIFNLEKVGTYNVLDENNEPTKEKKDILNFCVVGIRNGDYYVSFFGNIKEGELAETNFGAVKADGVTPNTKDSYDKAETEPYEVEIVEAFASAKFEKTDDGDTLVVIDIDEVTDESDADFGNYIINLYGKEAYDSNNHVINKVDDIPAIKTITVDAKKIGKVNEAGEPIERQGRIGVYANVYAKGRNKADEACNLNGSLEILDLTNAANIVE